MARKTKEIQLTTYDELLGLEESAGQVVEIALSELYPFHNHPFQVCNDEKMVETVESIRCYGVLNPALARPRLEGGYELVSGHRRKMGSEFAGKSTMPVIVRNYTDDEAVCIMVDSNIQRENILPSEKAHAYRMKMEALKHQGVKKEQDTAEIVGKDSGDSGRTVQRYIRLTELMPELLELVDDGKIKFIPAVKLSYLSKQEQEWVLGCIKDKGASVNGTMAETLKKHSEKSELTELAVSLILCETKKGAVKVTLHEEKIKQYFPKEYSKEQMEQVIYQLLENWKQEQ